MQNCVQSQRNCFGGIDDCVTKMARMWLDHLVKRLVGLGYGVIRINVVIESAIVINVVLFGFGPF